MGRQGGPSPAGANSETLLELLASFFALFEGAAPGRVHPPAFPSSRCAGQPATPPCRACTPCCLHWACLARACGSLLSWWLPGRSFRLQGCCAAAGRWARVQTAKRCAGAAGSLAALRGRVLQVVRWELVLVASLSCRAPWQFPAHFPERPRLPSRLQRAAPRASGHLGRPAALRALGQGRLLLLGGGPFRQVGQPRLAPQAWPSLAVSARQC